ncbi:protein HEXIM1-like [Diadema antillarum]|uniref:protein HEXIM1-like n=1 Tax=Diadema antillarum TaxID=105358 RepID=UPI003A83DA07
MSCYCKFDKLDCSVPVQSVVCANSSYILKSRHYIQLRVFLQFAHIMNKALSKIPGELESMDGDDERSDRSPSPRNLSHKTVQSQGGIQRHSQHKQPRARKKVTIMAVDIENSRRPNNQLVLRNMQQESQDSNGNDKSKKRRRPRKRNRKWKPYTQLSWEERQQRDEEESRRASLKRANRPTPYNTTQFLMEDHKVDTPDLSGIGAYDENNEMNLSSSDEIQENENDEYLVRNFTAVYDEVQSERLQQMSKEQLVNEVLELSKKVTELEDCLRPNSGVGGGEEKLSSGESDGHLDEATRSRLESVTDLEEEVKQLREENHRLRTSRISLNE